MKERYLSKQEKELKIEIPEDWEKTLKTLTERKNSAAILVGPVDSGKSTFASLLLERSPLNTLLLEADPGQPSFGIPALFSLVDSSGKILHQYFFGELSPVRNPADVLLGVHLLSKRAQGRNLIIDTSGFVAGELALRLKLAKAVLSKCNSAVIFKSEAYDYEKFSSLFTSSGITVFEVSVPERVIKYDFEQRRKRREEIFKRYFENASVYDFRVNISQIFGDFEWAEEELVNRLIGFEDKKMLCISAGLIKHVEIDRDSIFFKAACYKEPDKFSRIRISSLKINTGI